MSGDTNGDLYESHHPETDPDSPPVAALSEGAFILDTAAQSLFQVVRNFVETDSDGSVDGGIVVHRHIGIGAGAGTESRGAELLNSQLDRGRITHVTADDFDGLIEAASAVDLESSLYDPATHTAAGLEELAQHAEIRLVKPPQSLSASNHDHDTGDFVDFLLADLDRFGGRVNFLIDGDESSAPFINELDPDHLYIQRHWITVADTTGSPWGTLLSLTDCGGTDTDLPRKRARRQIGPTAVPTIVVLEDAPKRSHPLYARELDVDITQG